MNLAASLIMTVATVYLFVVMPKSFLPTVDVGFIFGGVEAAEDASFDEMVKLQHQSTGCRRRNPWIQGYGGGTGGFGGQNQGFIFMSLSTTGPPQGERDYRRNFNSSLPPSPAFGSFCSCRPC